MYIGEARCIINDSNSIRIMKRSVYLGESKDSVRKEALETFGPLFYSIKVKMFFTDDVIERLLIGFPDLLISSDDEIISLQWHERR